MSPLAAIRSHRAAQARLCRSSVVRMKSSLEMSSAAAMARNCAETSSANACGANPASRAVFSTFCPCSSVPVRNKTSLPSSRAQRATTSAAMLV